jgi:hypothetical protein
MPALQYLPRQVAATFARSRQNPAQDAVGWHTRMLYSFTAPDAGISWNGASDMFSAVADFPWTKGDNQFPPGYWDRTQGRILRIKGMFYYDTNTTDDILNVELTFQKAGGGSYISAGQNNYSDNHYFAAETARNMVPVFFEFNLMYRSSDNNPYGYFQWAGYYQYEYNSYNSEGYGSSTVFVPVYNSTYQSYTDNIHSNATEILLTVNGSSGDVYPQILTIEELG